MKKWRRSGGGRVPPPVNPPLVIAAAGGEFIEVTGVEPYFNTHYALPEVSPNGVDTWSTMPEIPIDQNPLYLDYTGLTGQYARVAPTLGDGNPVAPYSNVVQITS